jgi:ribosomal protein S18 acetylase RimI-like enzyme
MNNIKLVRENLFESDKTNDEQLVIKFQLFEKDNLVSESGFNIEQPDEWFDEKYVTIHDLTTFKEFRRKGFAKRLLEQIFDYVKNTLEINIITLIVYKDNFKAVNLYFDSGFKVFMEYDDSYSLIKNLIKK